MGIFSEYSDDVIRCVAFNRFGGTSKVPFASLNFADYVGDNPTDVRHNVESARVTMAASAIAVMKAEHGVRVQQVTRGGLCSPADILVCQTPNLAVLALSADCVTFTISDSSQPLFLVAHSGWKGLAQNIVNVALEHFVAQGGNLNSSSAVVGPAICGTCYRVDQERVDLVSRYNSQAVIDDMHLDIATGVERQLHAQVARVSRFAGCNFEDDSLFSYRRADGEPTGRGGMAVMLRKVDPQ